MCDSIEKYKQYCIIIGKKDMIKANLSNVLPGEHSSSSEIDIGKLEKKLQETLKEARVRTGTLLKTDNVSFLFGAGASMDAGGVTLATIPIALEERLVFNAKEEELKDESISWIHTFYETISFIIQKEYKYLDRLADFIIYDEKNTTAIALNLEDYLSMLYMWLASMGERGSTIKISIGDFSELVLDEKALRMLISKITYHLSALLDLPADGKEESLKVHRAFIKKILTRPLNLRRVNLFTLNYDTLLEQGADSEGAVLVDGFIGILKRVFRPETYDLDFYFPAQTTEGRVHRFDRALHLYKLHGSINWHRTEQSWENPYGLYASYYNPLCQDEDVLIYPSPLKYGQALGLPYSELFRRLGTAIAQPQSVLFTIGYGFGDDHVNAQIRQALAIPSFTLVIVDPDPRSDFVKTLINLGDERIWIVKGWELGTFRQFVINMLPDLREEEIDEKVMKTYKAISSSRSQVEVTEEINNAN